jgi:predicted NBD/HSP70 family sugar kinase/predicted transcriptional regulator
MPKMAQLDPPRNGNGHRGASLVQPALLGRMNERQVLRAIQALGAASRAEVTRHSGISAPTVSKAVAALLRSGMLEETEAPELGRGRPARRLQLATRRAQVLGLVIDAGQCRIASAGLDGRLHDGHLHDGHLHDGHLHDDRAEEFPTPKTYAALIDALATRARKLIDRPGISTLGAGISMPGLIDNRRQLGVLSPNVPITDGHSPSHDLAARLGVPCVLLQETHALCLAERQFGLARGLDDFAMLDVSTGVGLGVMSGGRLLQGHRGLAGEVGHITVVADGRPCGCGNRGCLETVASDSSVAWRASQRLRKKLSVDDLLAGAATGKLDLTAELNEACRYLSIGLATVINLFNPATLFVHGRMFDLDPGLFGRVRQETKRRALAPSYDDCRIVQARGSKRQGAVAGIIQHLTTAAVPDLA